MQPRPWLKPGIQGAVLGGLAVPIAGLIAGWLVFGGTAESRAQERAELAVVQALVPVCVSQAQADPAAQAKTEEFKALSSYKQADFVLKAGWATMPGVEATPNSGLAKACALVLAKALGA